MFGIDVLRELAVGVSPTGVARRRTCAVVLLGFFTVERIPRTYGGQTGCVAQRSQNRPTKGQP